MTKEVLIEIADGPGYVGSQTRWRRRSFGGWSVPLLRRWYGLMIAWLTLPGLALVPVHAQSDGSSEPIAVARPNVASTDDFEIQLGVSGHLRLGHWVPIKVSYKSDLVPTHYQITTLDGDNTTINHQGPLTTNPQLPQTGYGWIRLGRADLTIQVDLYATAIQPDSQPIDSITINLIADTVTPSTRSEICLVGGNSVLNDAIRNSAKLQGDDAPIVSQLDSLEQLPPHWLGLNAIQTIVLAGSFVDDLAQAQPQIQAIEDWVQRGGELLISVPEDHSNLIAENPALAELIPGTLIGPSEFSNSSRLESFAGSKEQLIPIRGEPLPMLELQATGSTELVSDGDRPLIVSSANGFGNLTFSCIDLTDQRFTRWSGYNSLVGQLLLGTSRSNSDSNPGRSRSTVGHLGYSDLIGQLRVPLERFTQVGFVAFTWIALLLGLYILCIGPLDYFLLRNLLGRMELTWITFPLFSLLFCGLAVAISYWSRPAEIQVNQLEIIDIDVDSGLCRGTVWTTLYSPQADTIEIDLQRQHDLGFAIDQSLVSWQGLPGSGLGGMSTRPYSVEGTRDYQQPTLINQDQVESHLSAVPLQVSSSRALFTQWYAPAPVTIRNRPRLNPRSDRVTGAIQNPFDFELRNCRLLVDEWAYLLGQPLEPGQSFDIQTGPKERRLRNSLTRRERSFDEKEVKSRSVPWDPTNTRVNRIADMMMFYGAAGGQGYTGLTHDYQNFVDLSGLLSRNRAILVGEVPTAGARLTFGNIPSNYDQETVIIRVILPIRVDQSQR